MIAAKSSIYIFQIAILLTKEKVLPEISDCKLLFMVHKLLLIYDILVGINMN